MPLLDALSTYIDAQTALTAATDLFKSFLPESPDACVAIFEYPGMAPRHNFGASSNFRTEHPKFQVICRDVAGEYDLARSQAETIFLLLEKLTETDLSGVRYHSIEALHSPFALEPDAKGRVLVSCSYIAMKATG